MVSASEPDQISQICFVNGAFLDSVCVGCVQIQEMVWLLGSGLSFQWITVFLVFRSKCHSAGCGRVDPRLASESAT